VNGAEIALVIFGVVLLGALVGIVILAAALLRSRGAGTAATEEASRLRSELSGEFARGRTETAEALTNLRKELNERLDLSARSTGERLEGSAKRVDERLEAVAKRIGEVGKSIAAMGEAQKRIRELAQDIAGLEKILQPPKARGGLGELLLENALREVLPEANFALQHGFTDGTRVDAVIKLEGRLVPVDSKFPLESFRRMTGAESEDDRRAAERDFKKDVKTRIDETATYIRPGEGTFDFALMYVPAENVYYEAVLGSPDEKGTIAAYARSKKVVPVSPNSLYAYLQVIALGLSGLKLEERAEEIGRELGLLGREFGVVAEEFRLLGRHLKNASAKWDDTDKRLTKFADRLEAIKSDAPEDEGGEETGGGS